MAVIIKQASEPLPRPKKFAPNLPQEVENIMLKALAKNPKDRYQDMSEFGRALERLTSGKATDIKNNAIPASGRQIKIKQPTVPRRMVISIGIIALVIGLLVILSFSLKSLPGILFPAAISSTTPTLKPASTPSNTPTPIFTATLSATHTPPASPTPALGIGSTWTRPADGMEMVYVPEGEFIMGSDDGYDDEMPVHQVFLDAFWIDRTEVTNAMYAKCVQAGSCKNPASSVRSSKYDQHPVQFVEWNDAQSYCSWAEVRLPTEAEWEKAARGTDGRTYSWGNDKDSTKYYLVYYGNYETKPVGSFPSGASPYGALDMAGGVLEWVNDWYSGTYYQTSPSSNPLGPDTGQARVLRGGTWNFSGYNVRSALRFRYNPSYTYSSLGFRCARPLP
jgi:formylglycine-generating enzyme required for sulfatase activity